MPRRYANEIPRGDRQLQVGGGAARSGAGRIAGVSAPGRVSPSPGRTFGVRAEGSWGLRLLAQSFGQFADASQRIMDNEFKIRAQEVEREQSLLGTEHGMGVEIDQLQLPAGDSIGDQAFRKSAILAASAKADIAAYDDVETLAKAHPGQPEAFKKAVGDRAKAFVGKLPPDMRPQILESYNRLGQRKYLELDEERRLFTRDENRASIVAATERYGNEAALRARRGDWAGAQQEIGKLATMASAAGPIEVGGSGAMSLVEIETQAQGARDLIQGQFLKGWVERTTNPRGALAALRSGQSGNADVDEVLAVTGPQVIDPLANQLEQEIKTRESEARAAAREAKQEARFTAGIIVDNEEAAAENGTTADPGWESKVRAAYGAHADPVIARINHTRDTAIAIGDLSTMPTAAINELIQGRLPQGEGYAYEAKDLAALQHAAIKVHENRLKDPAGEVLRSFPAVASSLADPAQAGSAYREMARIQTEEWGIPASKIQLLTPEQVTDTVDRFKTAPTVDERISILNGVTTAIGDDALARTVLSQLEDKGMPAGARFALEAQQRGDIDGARDILGGIAVDPKDLPKLGDADNGMIEAAVDGLMKGTGQAAVTQRSANMSWQPGLYSRAAAERQELLRLTRQYVASGDDASKAASKAERAIYGTGAVAGDDDLGYVRAPEGVDAGDLTDALGQARATVDLSKYDVPVAAARPGQGGTGAEEQARDFAGLDLAEWKQHIRDDGIWVNVDGGYALLDPTTGRQVVFMTHAQVMATQAAPSMMYTPGLPSGPDPYAPTLEEWQQGPGDALQGGAGNDRLAGVVNATGGGINPQLGVLLQRLLGRLDDPQPAQPEGVTPQQLQDALGIPPFKPQAPPQSQEPQSYGALDDPSMPGMAANAELLKATGIKLGGGRLSTNVEDRRGKPTETESLYKKIRSSAMEDGGLSANDAEMLLGSVESQVGLDDVKLLKQFRLIWERIQDTGAKAYWNPAIRLPVPKSKPRK